MNANESIKEGNECFSSNNFNKALNYYTQAINTLPDLNNIEELLKANDLFVQCFRNRSKCNLELREYLESIDDADKVLSVVSDDKEALYSRSQAFKGLKLYEKALEDANRFVNSEFSYINDLNDLIKKKSKEFELRKQKLKTIINSKPSLDVFTNLLDILKDSELGNECKDGLIAFDGLKMLSDSIKNETTSQDAKILIIKIFSEFCKNSLIRTKSFYIKIQGQLVASLISDSNQEISNQAREMIQTIILALTDLDNKRSTTQKQKKNRFDFVLEEDQYIDEIFRSLIAVMANPQCSGYGRDNCIDLCTKFVNRANGCGWTIKFIQDGLTELLRIAATITELKLPNNLPLTENTKMYVASCLKTIAKDLYLSEDVKKFQNKIDEFINDLIEFKDDVSSCQSGVACLNVILQGAFDAGINYIENNSKIFEVIFKFSISKDISQEKISAEAIFYSAVQNEGFFNEGIAALKFLKKSKNLDVKVRALAGTCKYALHRMQEDFNDLVKSFRDFICDSTEFDLKKWACEGLSCATLVSGNTKEMIASDKSLIESFGKLAKQNDIRLLLNISSILYNVCSVIPSDLNENILDILRSVYKNGNNNLECNESISGIYNVFCQDHEICEAIVNAGSIKTIFQLALNNTDLGKIRAANALARLACNTEIQCDDALDIVVPIISNLHPERDSTQVVEALKALTNLANTNDKIRKKIVREQGIGNIEHYMFSEDEYLRIIGTECICALVQDEDVLFLYEKEDTDRIKLLVLFCGEDDLLLNMAASSALDLLSRNSKKICQKILKVSSFIATFKDCIMSDDVEFQLKSLTVLKNIVVKGKFFSDDLMNSELKETIVAMSQDEVDNEREMAKKLAIEIVDFYL